MRRRSSAMTRPMPTTPTPIWPEILPNGTISATLTSGLHPSPELQAFRDDYAKKFNVASTPFAETSYDSIMMLAQVHHEGQFDEAEGTCRRNSTTPRTSRGSPATSASRAQEHITITPDQITWSNTMRRPRNGSRSRTERAWTNPSPVGGARYPGSEGGKCPAAPCHLRAAKEGRSRRRLGSPAMRVFRSLLPATPRHLPSTLPRDLPRGFPLRLESAAAPRPDRAGGHPGRSA